MSRASLNRLAAGSLLGLVLAGASVVAAPAALAAPSPVVSATTVAPGQSFTVSGVDCELSTDPTNPDGALAFLDITHLGLGESPEIQVVDYVDPGGDGTWTMTLTVPANHPLGTYDLVSVCTTYYGDPEFLYPTLQVTIGAAAPAAPAACGTNCQVIAPGSTLTPGGVAIAPGVVRNLALYGYLPFEQVKLVLHSTPQTLGTFTADANGIVVVSFKVPAGTAAGDHTLKVTRADGSVVSYAVKIAAAGKQLASTGADVTVPLVGGTALLLAGGGALFLSRRRREAAQV